MSTQATLPPETPAEAKRGGGVVLQRLVGRHSWALLINANCLDVRDEMNAAQVVITDPPYGTGKYVLDEDSTVQECLKPWAPKTLRGIPCSALFRVIWWRLSTSETVWKSCLNWKAWTR